MPRLCLLAVCLVLLVSACQRRPDARRIVERAVAVHGGDVLRHGIVSFTFRDRRFTATRDGGRFTYERTFTDSTGLVHDVLGNDTLYREVDGVPVALTEAQRRSVESGLNSVVYFALLPFNLTDPAVQLRYLGPAEVEGEPYHEVEVTFRQEGGGRGYRDRYVYWFHRDRHTMDYLAYTFEEDGGGTRFRKALNTRTVGGVRFADYANYTSDSLGADIERYDDLLHAGLLRKVSDVVLEDVRVEPLPDGS